MTDTRHPLLDSVIQAIGEDLIYEGWLLDDEGEGEPPAPGDYFYDTCAKHMARLLPDEWRKHRIAELEAELRMLREDR